MTTRQNYLDFCQEHGTADATDTAEWNAYRWPTPSEVASGRAEWDTIWLGAGSKTEAIRLLPKKDGSPYGQIQQGREGQVHNL